MNKIVRFIRGRYPLALGAGLILACAFPNIGVAGLAWIAPGLFLLVSIGAPPKHAFRLGFVAGLGHYLASLSWLLRIPMNWMPEIGWFFLSAYLSLYPALWVWLCWKLFPAPISASDRFDIRALARSWLAAGWSRRLAWSLACAALWVALEMTISRFLTGFPWNLLGASQFKIVPLIQIAAFTGIYGVSFLVVWTSLCLLGAAMAIVGRPAMRGSWVVEIFPAAAVVAALYGFGWHRISHHSQPGPTLRVALIQPSIPQTLIWDSSEDEARFQNLLDLSKSALTNHPDVVIWPEAAVPGLVLYDPRLGYSIADFARTNKIWMVISGDNKQMHREPSTPEDADYFNSSFLISPEGQCTAEYRKRHLVAFGEYVPLMKFLPFMKFFTAMEDGGYSSGTKTVPFELTNLKTRLSVLICFEDVFPDLVREYATDDTDFLVNLTNNGWFGEGSAQWQHAASAAFRAVENGVPLIRCANNGLTCWMDSHGSIRALFSTKDRGIYGPGFMMADIPLLEPGQTRPPTLYNQRGDWFGWTCVGFSALQVIRLRAARRKKIAQISLT